jgi:molybdenum cofactor cytidylyltransferase
MLALGDALALVVSRMRQFGREDFARSHPAGSLKGCPPDARVSVLVNKVESDERRTFARDIAHRLLYPSVDAEGTEGKVPVSTVVIASLQREQPIAEVRRRVAAVVLAAGCSTRMAGEIPKQLLPWHKKTVVEQVVERLSTCPLAPLLVVVGHHAEQVHLLLAGTGARSVYNPDYETGEMLSSLKVALCHLDSTVSACLVFLVDQP